MSEQDTTPTPGEAASKPRTHRVLSGIQSTGAIHWGNYFGAVRQYIALQRHGAAESRARGGQALYFIADLHALTTVRDAALMREYVTEAAVTLLALGLDPEQATLFVQSDVPEVTELTWLLMTVTPLPMLENCHSYKDKKARGITADAGLFTYPILMAADILAYDSTLVPVGQDQKQHIEVTRDVAAKFNGHFGAEVFTIPEPYILDATAKIVGTDGEKMSKSYGNTIPVFDTPKRLKKTIMGIPTDSATVEEPKDPDASTIYTLFALFASDEEQRELAARYRAGGMGYGDAKKALLEKSREHFAEAVARREDLLAHPERVEEVLRAGAEVARRKAGDVLARAREACGLRRTPRA